MNDTKDLIEKILGPRTVATAMQGIRQWDSRPGSQPLLSEQIRCMSDGPQTWSTTHSWPSVRSTMGSLGLIEELEPLKQDGWKIPVTQITELGREVRDALLSEITTL